MNTEIDQMVAEGKIKEVDGKFHITEAGYREMVDHLVIVRQQLTHAVAMLEEENKKLRAQLGKN